MLLQGTQPATFSLLRQVKGSQSRGQNHDPARCEGRRPLLLTDPTSPPENLGYYGSVKSSVVR